MTDPIPTGVPTRPGPRPRVVVPYPRLTPGLRRYFATEGGGATLLLAASTAALVWANLPGESYEHLWETATTLEVGSWGVHLSLHDWVNDALMAIFFLVVGLEVNRELTVGELRSFRAASVPLFAAVGGLAVPIALYLLIAPSGPDSAGWGVPMSTDTAFVIGVLALVGPRCPDQLRVFLLTLAIFDDIGAIALLGAFYADDLSIKALVLSGVLVAVLFGMRWVGIWQIPPYILVGIGLWVTVLESGLHPTLAGVLVGLSVPTRRRGREDEVRRYLGFYGRALIEDLESSRSRLAVTAVRSAIPTSDRLLDALHPLSSYLIVPLFGLANAGVVLTGGAIGDAMSSPITLGVVAGLLVGKVVGVTLGAFVALRTGLGSLPGRVQYGHVVGGAFLCGIGFTIALFVSELAFDDEALRNEAKVGILLGSLTAGLVGALVLRYFGDRLPLCSPDEADGPPPLPEGPWRAPA
ncbi:Na+/H+ antiporter NhaA [Mumia sp. zg.B21]|uniref:Na+/H+ antiporter NhaA n=1 Tax=Mumia sp. zg.B21 TaxID=2855447 RepID=UPI001C6F14A8|nr:Na+/H+ antiporter NhaA [Mumia sp. zg.B21]MBW9209813.1 Na+/H+ antiporter NhaA [Mumia sp. zg.B21]